MFAWLGYLPSATTDLEVGYSKVALYENDDGPSHAARQEVGTTRWLSKLGKAQDIAHHTAEDLEGPYYGKIIRKYKRPIDVGSMINVRLVHAMSGDAEVASLVP